MADTTPPVAPRATITGQWTLAPQATLVTSLGTVVLELDPNAAPATAANFLAYANSGFYDNLIFHRVIPGFMVQGGGFTSGPAYQTPTYANLPLESGNGLSNARGTIAMARTNSPHTASSQFFINVVNNDFLDYSSDTSPGYAVFGRVVTGLSVVDAIAAVSTGSRFTGTQNQMNDVPVQDVLIQDASQTRIGLVHSEIVRIGVSGIEQGAAWQYSLNRGTTWISGAKGSFSLARGAYEAEDLLVRQTDTAGNPSVAAASSADIVVDAATAMVGTRSANTLTGGGGNEALYALGGNDVLDGGAGSDTLWGGSGNDTYRVRDLGDVVVETSLQGSDTLQSFVSAYSLPANVEFGRVMNVTGSLTGNPLANILYASRGSNVLDGSGGDDTVSYQYGVPTSGTAGVTVSLLLNAQATVASGTDTLTSIEHLTGSALGDTLTGNGAGNRLSGLAGADSLAGGEGADTLTGGPGADTLTGGTGADVFDVNAATEAPASGARERIIDFVRGQDRIDLSTLDANTTTVPNDAFALVTTAFTGPGQLLLKDGVLLGNVNADPAADFAIELTGVTQIDAADLVL